MSIFRGDASEVYALAADLSQIGAKSVPVARSAMTEAAKVVETAWRNKAAGHFDSHAKHYPDSIDSELVFGISGIAADIGPNRDSKQGFLGRILEFGGERSPAYLDGASALAENEGRVEKVFAERMDPLFG